MRVVSLNYKEVLVALRKESVDRNRGISSKTAETAVALRKESVDRNDIRYTTSTRPSIVALRKESVDRNALWTALNRLLRRSLSARRAWIEI